MLNWTVLILRREHDEEMISVLCTVLFSTLVWGIQPAAPAEVREDRPGEDDLLQKIVLLSGAADEEALDGQTMERFEALRSRPLRINLTSRSRLLSSGLFTPYQVAALCDYRERNGDVLSIMELALVDGFGPQYAHALEPFISFASPGLEPAAGGKYVHGEVIPRATYTNKGFVGGLKLRCSWHDRLELASALSNTSGHAFFPPERKGIYLAAYGKYHLDKIILGDFNARFGQGLGAWTGFTMRGFSSYGTFFHRPMGLSPSWSYSSANLRGLAADFNFGRFVLSSALACPELRTWMDGKTPHEVHFLPLLNLAYYGRKGQYSLTSISSLSREGNYEGRLSADFRYDLKGTALFGEGAWDIGNGKFATVLGSVLNLGPKTKLSFLVRYYPFGFYNEFCAPASMSSKAGDEWGVALGADVQGYVFTLDFASHPVKRSLDLKAYFSKNWKLKENLMLVVRATDRWKITEAENKVDLRLDWKYERNRLLAVLRTEAAFARNLGILGYTEAGYKNETLSSYARLTFFRIDNWEDRIYSYERDAPGNFNIPAYYGRGWAFSANYSHKFRFAHSSFRLYLRVGTIQYFRTEEKKKPGKAELKLQISYDF